MDRLLDEAPLVDAAEALHHDRRDRKPEPRDLGLVDDRLRKREASLRPAQDFIEKLARLPDEGASQILFADEAEVDEGFAEQFARAVVALLQDDAELVARDEAFLDEVTPEAKLVGRALSAREVDEPVAKGNGDLDFA